MTILCKKFKKYMTKTKFLDNTNGRFSQEILQDKKSQVFNLRFLIKYSIEIPKKFSNLMKFFKKVLNTSK